MRKSLAVLVIMCFVGGAGPLTGLASAQGRPSAPSSGGIQRNCMTLPELHQIRQRTARRALDSADPAAAYRAELVRAAAAATLQPYECVAGLRTAMLVEAKGLVRLDSAEDGGGSGGLGSETSIGGDRGGILEHLERMAWEYETHLLMEALGVLGFIEAMKTMNPKSLIERAITRGGGSPNTGGGRGGDIAER